jgi:hypothetical protein
MMDALHLCANIDDAMEKLEKAYNNPMLDTFQLDILKLNVLYKFKENLRLSNQASVVLLPKYKDDVKKLHTLLDTLLFMKSASESLDVANRLLELNESDFEARVKRIRAIAYSNSKSHMELMNSDFNYVMSLDSMNDIAWVYNTIYLLNFGRTTSHKSKLKILNNKFPMNVKIKYMYLLVLFEIHDREFCSVRQECLDLDMHLDQDLLDYTCN